MSRPRVAGTVRPQGLVLLLLRTHGERRIARDIERQHGGDKGRHSRFDSIAQHRLQLVEPRVNIVSAPETGGALDRGYDGLEHFKVDENRVC